MSISLLVLLIVSVFTSCVCGLNILGVFPHSGKSHFDVFVAITKGLAEKGHNVTVISYYPLKEPVNGYNDIILDYEDLLQISITFEAINAESRLLRYTTPVRLKYLAAMTCETVMSSIEFKGLFMSKEKFDIMLIELFNSDCFLGMAKKLKAEIIGLSSCSIMSWYHDRFGNPSHSAYIPNNLLTFTDKMNFFERLENSIITFIHNAYYNNIVLRSDKRLAKDMMGSNYADIEESVKKIRLILANTHFSLHQPKPLAPSVIEIGGVHITKANILPKDLEKWISESKEGVIYFSMGSLLKGHTLPKEKKDAFLKAFAKLPQRVLWKWENDTMEDKPDNVMIQKWMPQFDILSHPNVKAFVSHGGLLGITEAVHCGVPMVIMPQFGDQHTNAKAIESKGGGVILPLSQVTEESVYKALKTVLSSSFREQAKQLSEIFRDRPLPPLETAIYWIEYVARHKGAPHMRTAAVDMPFYQYYLLDVFAFLILVVSTFIYVTYLLCRTIIRWMRRSSIKEKTS